MHQMTLTRMPSGELVGLTFTEAREFNIDRGADGAMILAPHRMARSRFCLRGEA